MLGQNNYTNKFLEIIGQQLDKIEQIIQHLQSQILCPLSKDDKSLFKPHKSPKEMLTKLSNRHEFIDVIN